MIETMEVHPMLEVHDRTLSQREIEDISKSRYYNNVLPNLEKNVEMDGINIKDSSFMTSVIELVNEMTDKLPANEKIDEKQQCYAQMSEVRDMLIPPEFRKSLPPLSIKEIPWLKQLSFRDPLSDVRFGVGGMHVRLPGLRNTVLLADYKSPHNAAHEEAHRFGIKDEADAETVALLAGLKSSDEKVRYFTLKRVVNSLTQLHGLTEKAMLDLPLHQRIKDELIEKHKENAELDKKPSALSKLMGLVFGGDKASEKIAESTQQYVVKPLQRIAPLILQMKQPPQPESTLPQPMPPAISP